jgi:hypothetical protein
MSRFHLKNGVGASTEFFCQFCPEVFKSRKNRAYHKQKEHLLDVQIAVDRAYTEIHATLAPASVPVDPVETTSVESSIPTENCQGDTFNIPIWTIQTPLSTFEGSQVYTAPPASTWDVEQQETISLTSPVDQPEQLVELRWDGEITSPPTINYVPTQFWSEEHEAPPPVPVEMRQHIALPTLTALNQDTEESPEPEPQPPTWRPTITIDGSEPQWMVERIQQLQNLLDSAAPTFEYGKTVGTDMCLVCIEHFDKLKREVEETCSTEELEALKAYSISQ